MQIKPFMTGCLSSYPRIVFSAALLLGLVVYGAIIHPLLFGLQRHIPGPWLTKITSLYLAYYDVTYSRNIKIREWHQRYGPVVCISPNEVSVASLEAVREVYAAACGWSKSDYFDNFMGYNQRSVFATKSYQEHRKKRKLTSAFYQATTIYKVPEFEQHIRSRCQAVLKQIEQSHEVDVFGLTDWYAFDIITYLVFGPDHRTCCIDGPCQERGIIEKLKHLQFVTPLRTRFPRLFSWISPFIAWRVSPANYLQAEDELAGWCRQRTLLAIGDSSLFGSRSLLRHLSQTKASANDNEASLDGDFIAAELLDNINAARATVAVTGTYLIWLLGRNPQWQLRIRDELRALPAQADGSVAFADVDSRVPTLEASLREVYRLYAASSGRAERVVPPGGSTLSKVYLPEGTIVSSSISALHRDETLFPDPGTFEPRRWLEADSATLKARSAQLIPFGYGGRICLGKAVATMELKLLAAALCLRYEMTPSPTCTPELMQQCSTHDAVPRVLACMIQFQRLDTSEG